MIDDDPVADEVEAARFFKDCISACNASIFAFSAAFVSPPAAELGCTKGHELPLRHEPRAKYLHSGGMEGSAVDTAETGRCTDWREPKKLPYRIPCSRGMKATSD